MEEICAVCGKPLDGENVARCISCGGRFHLAWSVHAEVTDCGRVWVDDNVHAMVFMCDNCLGKREGGGSGGTETWA